MNLNLLKNKENHFDRMSKQNTVSLPDHEKMETYAGSQFVTVMKTQ